MKHFRIDKPLDELLYNLREKKSVNINDKTVAKKYLLDKKEANYNVQNTKVKKYLPNV